MTETVRARAARAALIGAVLAALACLAACAPRRAVEKPGEPPALPAARETYKPVEWSRIDGWRSDATHEAWAAFLNSCRARGRQPAWAAVCLSAKDASVSDAAGARAFFEAHFSPYRIQQEEDALRPRDTGLITGYYEPLLYGARAPAPTFTVPLYAPPDDLLTIDLTSLYPELKGKPLRGRVQGRRVVPYFSRAELDGAPSLRGKEIAWVNGVLDAFYLQVQGSGRVQLTDGTTIRLAYADQNGHPYRSIGRYLVEKGELTTEQATAQGIRDWIDSHPARAAEVLHANPSFVFFREEAIEDPAVGPKGALGVPLTAGRSIAVDPRFIPLGAPVFLSSTFPASDVPLQRLTVAQDTGGAIKGAVRADLFWGFGRVAGESAGRMRQNGNLWLLWPRGQPLPQPD